jgi:hypothetical protein
MADYSRTTWVDDVTPLSPANLNNMEAGIKDAAEHHSRVTALPTPTAALKHSIIMLDAPNGVQGQAYYCDGSTWTKIGQPEDGGVVDITAPSIARDSLGFQGTRDPFGTGSVLKRAFKFVPANSFTLTRGTFELARDVAISFDQDTGWNLVVKILNDNAGVPGATTLGSGTLPVWKITQSGQAESIAFNNVALTAGTTYWCEFSLNFTPAANMTVGRGIGGGLGSVSWNGTTWTSTGLNIRYSFFEGTEDVALQGANNSARINGGAVKATVTSGIGVQVDANNGIGVNSTVERGTNYQGNAHYGAVFRARRQASNSEADMFRSEDQNGTPNFRVDKDGKIAAAAKGSDRHGLFYDSGEVLLTTGSSILANFTGLHMLTVGLEYELIIQGQCTNGAAVIYAQPNFTAAGSNPGSSKWQRMRGFGTTVDAAGAGGADTVGCPVGFTDWGAGVANQIQIHARFNSRGWNYYQGWQSDYMNQDNAVDTLRFVIGKVDGFWTPPSTPITEISDMRVVMSAGTFQGWTRLRAWGN